MPELTGAHSQAETLEELNANLREVVGLMLDDGPPPIAGEFVAHRRGTPVPEPVKDALASRLAEAATDDADRDPIEQARVEAAGQD